MVERLIETPRGEIEVWTEGWPLTVVLVIAVTEDAGRTVERRFDLMAEAGKRDWKPFRELLGDRLR